MEKTIYLIDVRGFMCAFWKKLGKAVKEIEKVAKELGAEKESSQELHEKQTAPSEGRDIRQYLTVDEVARITKLSIDTYTPYLDDTWEGGVYTSSDPKTHTYFQVWFNRKDPDGYNDENVWNYLLETLADLQPVLGIGDEAFWSNSTGALIIRKLHDVLHVVTTSDRGISLGVMKRLVGIIMEKI